MEEVLPIRTTTQIFIDDDGINKTRVWYGSKEKGLIKQKMYVINTDKSQIRRTALSYNPN